jgi:ferredoxin--NADP+ reductase
MSRDEPSAAPPGRIGNNKPDSASTVDPMVADIPTMRGIRDDHRALSRTEAFLRRRGIDYATYQDGRILDNYEVTAGVRQGRPRIKSTTVPEMMEVVHQGR